MPNKVMVAIPTTDYVHINFTLALASLALSTKTPLRMQIARGSSICQNRNTLVQARRTRSRIHFVHRQRHFLSRLCRRSHGSCHRRKQAWMLSAATICSKRRRISGWSSRRKATTPCRRSMKWTDCLAGMLMIRMSVFDKLEQPYFNYDAFLSPEGGSVGSEDYYFCDRARDKGIKIWMDTDLSFGLVHWGSPIGVRWIPEDPGYQYLQEPLKYGTKTEV